MVVFGYLSDRMNKWGVFMVGILFCFVIGFSILWFFDNVNVKYVVVFLNVIGCFGVSSGFLSWGINNVGSFVVVVVVGGYMVMIGSFGGVLFM